MPKGMMGMSGMMPWMNPYGNPYGMPGMMPGNDLPAMGNAIDISMMNGNITLSKPLSNFNNPSQKSIYSYFINKKIQSNKFDNIETKFKYLIDFDESPHSKILKYLRNTNANIDDSDLNLIKILDQPNDYFNILSTNEAAKVADNKLRRTNSGYIPAYPTKWRSFASFGSNDDKYMEIGKPIRIFKNQGGELKLVAGFGGVDGNVSIPIENKKFKKIAKIGFGKVEHGKEGTDFINGKAYFVCGIWGPIDEGDKISPIDGFLGYYKIRIEPMRQDSNLNMIDWNPTTHKLIDHETGQEITLLHEPKNQAQRKRGLNPKFVDLIADGRLPWE